MPSWPVHMKFVWTFDQRNMIVFAMTVRRLWKPLRLPKPCSDWCNNAEMLWMIFHPSFC